jgi:formylmethanofuran dehydrogenase subunit E
MMVDLTFKRVADFHGHICPDLVLGGKLCEYIQQLLLQNQSENNILNIIAENSTSALDAIQFILGATLGNQRLKITDFGKHNYTVITKNRSSCFRFSLNSIQFDDEKEYNLLAQKILDNCIPLFEVVRFRGLIDHRVNHLLKQPPDALFKMMHIFRKPQPTEIADIYVTCHCCKEQVLISHVIEYWNDIYCIPCFQRMNTESYQYRLH